MVLSMDVQETAQETSVTSGSVLIVDDSQAIRERLASLVSRISIVGKVLMAARMREAVQIAASERPAVVLVDVHIGDGDGETLLCELRQSLPKSCLVALVRYNSPAIAEEYKRLGADNCFDKGMELALLLDLVAHRAAGQMQPSKTEQEEKTP